MNRFNCNLKVVFCSWDWLLSQPRPGEALRYLGYNSPLFGGLLEGDTGAEGGGQDEASYQGPSQAVALSVGVGSSPRHTCFLWPLTQGWTWGGRIECEAGEWVKWIPGLSTH